MGFPSGNVAVFDFYRTPAATAESTIYVFQMQNHMAAYLITTATRTRASASVKIGNFH